MKKTTQKRYKPLSLNIFILIKKTFFELFSFNKFFLSVIILILLPILFILPQINFDFISEPLEFVLAMLKSPILFPLYFWTLGVALASLIAITGAPLLSEKISSGAMLILISKPIKRRNIYLGKFIGLFLYYLFLSSISIFSVVWITVFRFSSNIFHFISLTPLILSLFLYGLLINFIFSSLTISFSGIIRNPRMVFFMVMLIVLYCFIVFALITTPALNIYHQFGLYYYDLGYHLGNLFFTFLTLFSDLILVGNVVISFINYTGLVVSGTSIYNYTLSHYFAPLISFSIWIGIAVWILLTGMFFFQRKEITT